MDKTTYSMLLQKIRDNDLVLWVGAGFSKYAGLPLGSELVEKLKEIIDTENRQYINGINSLPDLAEEIYQIKGNKIEIIKFLKKQLDKKIDISKLNAHTSVKNIPQLRHIITTNYDCLFEKVFQDDLEVICKDSDVSFISQDKPNLYKIHGDFNNKTSYKKSIGY